MNNLNAETETNAYAEAQETIADGAPASQPKPPVSEARLRANRNNAKKSTGPKTARGKAYSRGNALKHGLTAKYVMFAADGTPVNDELHQLWDRLYEKYDHNDVLSDLLVDTVLVEYWRLGKALNHEIECFKNPSAHFSQLGNMSNLQRYRTASQRALEKTFELLGKLPPPTSSAAEDEAAPDGSTLEPANSPSAPKPPGGSSVVGTDKGPPSLPQLTISQCAATSRPRKVRRTR